MRTDELSQIEIWLARGGPQVHCVFCNAPSELPEIVEGLAERAAPPFSVVSVDGETGAGLAEHLEQAVQVLAEAVLVRHPSLGQSAAARLQRPTDGLEADSRPAMPRRLPASWWQRTLEACRAGRVPRCRDLALGVEAERLALCLDPERLVLTWVAPLAELSGPQLLGLARAAEWLATSTRASVILALSSRYASRIELDSISYEALVCATDASSEDVVLPQRSGATAADGAGTPATPARKRRTPRVAGLWPVIGQPHPLSPAELCFAKVLAADDELASAFRWNQVVVTRQNTRPIVDLVCAERRLIVEIDGFAHHGSRAAFERDRQRDWELMISGYRVLRLAASEVLADPPRRLQKLRTLTRMLAGDR